MNFSVSEKGVNKNIVLKRTLTPYLPASSLPPDNFRFLLDGVTSVLEGSAGGPFALAGVQTYKTESALVVGYRLLCFLIFHNIELEKYNMVSGSYLKCLLMKKFISRIA